MNLNSKNIFTLFQNIQKLKAGMAMLIKHNRVEELLPMVKKLYLEKQTIRSCSSNEDDADFLQYKKFYNFSPFRARLHR